MSRPPDWGLARQARPLTIAQAKNLLWHNPHEWTVGQLEIAVGVRPVRMGRLVHHWHLADGVLLTVSAPQPDGRQVITCWGPVREDNAQEKAK